MANGCFNTMHVGSTHSPATLRSWTSQPVWLASAAFLLLILLANPNYRWSTERASPFAADFVQEWVAGDMLLCGAGDRIYQRQAFQDWQHDAARLGFRWPDEQYYPAVYPPHYYLLTAPLACLPYRAVGILWLCLLVWAYTAAACLAQRMWPTAQPLTANLLWSVCLLMPAMFFGCVLGQKGSLWLLVVTSSVYLHKQNRPLLAGCVAALLTLKPTLCVLLPLVMLVNGQWRFCVGFASGASLLLGLAGLVLPTNVWSDYLHVLSSAGEYQTHAGYRAGWSSSALSLLTTLGLPKMISLGLLALGGLALIGSIVARCRHRSLTSPLCDADCLWMILSGTALLSPHSYFYDLTWLMLPLSAGLVSQPRQTIVKLAIVWVGMVLGQMFEYGPALPALALLVSLNLLFDQANKFTWAYGREHQSR